VSRDFGRCPICGKDFEDCPHSLGDVERLAEERRLREFLGTIVRKMVREELGKYARAKEEFKDLLGHGEAR